MAPSLSIQCSISQLWWHLFDRLDVARWDRRRLRTTRPLVTTKTPAYGKLFPIDFVHPVWSAAAHVTRNAEHGSVGAIVVVVFVQW